MILMTQLSNAKTNQRQGLGLHQSRCCSHSELHSTIATIQSQSFLSSVNQQHMSCVPQSQYKILAMSTMSQMQSSTGTRAALGCHEAVCSSLEGLGSQLGLPHRWVLGRLGRKLTAVHRQACRKHLGFCDSRTQHIDSCQASRVLAACSKRS